MAQNRKIGDRRSKAEDNRRDRLWERWRTYFHEHQVTVFFVALMLFFGLGLWYVDERADRNADRVAAEAEQRSEENRDIIESIEENNIAQALDVCLASNEARLGARRAIEGLVILALARPPDDPRTAEEQEQVDEFLARFQTEVLSLLAPIDCEAQVEERFGRDITLPFVPKGEAASPTTTTTTPEGGNAGTSGAGSQGSGGTGAVGQPGPQGPSGPPGPPGSSPTPPATAPPAPSPPTLTEGVCTVSEDIGVRICRQ